MFSLRTILHALFFIAAAVITDADPLRSQTVNWTQVPYSSAPSARENGGVAYDAATHSSVLFGGYGNPEVYGVDLGWRMEPDVSRHIAFAASRPRHRI